jgi:hypothetical protein
MKGLIKIMEDEKYKNYVIDLISIIKKQAKEAKLEADHPKEGYDSFNNGYLMAYHTVIEFMKNQTEVFNIDQGDVGLADIEPERDLL